MATGTYSPREARRSKQAGARLDKATMAAIGAAMRPEWEGSAERRLALEAADLHGRLTDLFCRGRRGQRHDRLGQLATKAYVRVMRRYRQWADAASIRRTGHRAAANEYREVA